QRLFQVHDKMMLKFYSFLLILGLALVCQGYTGNKCEQQCFDVGTYNCPSNPKEPCVCLVGFQGDKCQRQNRTLCNSQCQGGGECVFSGTLECECPEGFWGRLCEHSDSEVAHILINEKKLAQKYCGENEDCVPPHMQVACSNKNVDLCDEYGDVRPFKKCPYPWHCFEAFKNGKCDWECERKECLFDGYECSTNRPCKKGCRTSTGACNLECSLDINQHPELSSEATIIELSLAVSEEYWWKHKNEIIANISDPLRTPLVYSPEHNERLEKNKNSLENILSRGRRNGVKKNGHVVVKLSLLTNTCAHNTQCTADGTTAIKVLSIISSDEKSDPSLMKLITKISFPSTHETNGSVLLAVSLVIIAVPIVLIGYRVVTAPIWVPPKSEYEVPVVWSTDVVPHNPFNRFPTPLHEEAYSLSKISLPVCQDYVNRMDEQGRTPLFWLIASRKSSQLMLDDVNELVKAGANPNHFDDKGNTPLSIAITALRPSICNRLVQWGADPAAINSSEASCLHLAVAQDDIKCVEWLLSFPSVRNNINEVDDSDRTPLAMTAQGGVASARIAEILIEEGADVLHQGNHYTMWRYRGRTALHWAAQFNNLDVMKVLIDHRSDVNCVDTENCTPLHLAVQRGSESAARMLLEAQASTIIPNGLGATPLAIAQEKGIQSLIELISWYTDVSKEGLVMKKKATKREKKMSYSGSEYSKRSCPNSPFYNDSLSNSSSISSGYVVPPFFSDSSSISSCNSMTSSSSVSGYSVPSSPWSSSSESLSSFTLPKKMRPPLLPPINENPVGHFSFDFVRSEVSVPPGINSTQSFSTQSIGESGISSDFLDSVMLSPSSENNPLERGGCDSPLENLGTNYWLNEEKKQFDGFGNDEELLQEFFVDWQN
ncbi:hypothetical protein PRIPAC_71739, partial [Pristionchus pacificus]